MYQRSRLKGIVILGFFVALAAGCSLLPNLEIHDPIERGNLIVNPGFEEVDGNGRFVGWSTYVPAGEGHADAAKVSTDARTGQYAALIDVADALPGVDTGKRGARQNFQQRIDAFSDFVVPGKTYRFSAYYRTEGNPKPRLTLQIPGLPHPTTGDLPPAEDWTYAEVIFEWPPHDKWVAAGLWTYYSTEGKVWFDDVQLVLID